MYRYVNERHNRIRVLLLFGALLVASERLRGEEVLETLETTVVEAIRIELSEEDAPYSIYSLTGADFEKTLSRNVVESLEGQPGVSVQKTSNGQGSPYLRGFTGYRTLSTIDGVRYNNSVYRDGPNEYFSLIDSQSISGFELIQGPGSVLYGSDAIGGTLNLQTKSSDYILEDGYYAHGSQAYRYGSAENSHLFRTELQLGEGGKWGLQLGYSCKEFGDVDAASLGVQPKTGYGEQAWDARFDMVLNQNWSMTLVHQGLTQDDVWRTHSTIYAKSFKGTEVGSDLSRLKDQQRSLNYLRFLGEYIQPWLDQVSLTLSYQAWDEDGQRQRSNKKSLSEYFHSRMIGVDLEMLSNVGQHILSYGVDFYRDNVDSGRVDYNADGSVDRVRIQGPVGDDSTYDLLGLYAQDLIELSDRTDVILGGRYTYARASIGRYEDPVSRKPAAYDGNWHNLVASVRAVHDLDNSGVWKAWGGLSQSFRAPNIADLSRYGGSRSDEIEIAATNLKSEKFLTGEIGLKAVEEKYQLTASYYYTFVDDYITSTPTRNMREGLNEVTKRNSAEGFIQGVEIAGSYELAEGWRLLGNVTWLDGELESFVDSSSSETLVEPMSRLMPLTLNAAVRWTSGDEKIWAELGCLFADKADKLSSRDKEDTQRIPPSGTPGYTLVHLRGGYKVNDHLDLTLGVENILDEAYRVHGSGSNEPGLGMVFGARASF
ncbi:MAG: TonB-dependent receptor [Rubritalea sp.]|uniref:TonB-dependent receptor plug domain-containing protein n=1 Tax=Rubritalea sp. TaxID=2109375 RepID=UPI003241DC9D